MREGGREWSLRALCLLQCLCRVFFGVLTGTVVVCDPRPAIGHGWEILFHRGSVSDLV